VAHWVNGTGKDGFQCQAASKQPLWLLQHNEPATDPPPTFTMHLMVHNRGWSDTVTLLLPFLTKSWRSVLISFACFCFFWMPALFAQFLLCLYNWIFNDVSTCTHSNLSNHTHTHTHTHKFRSVFFLFLWECRSDYFFINVFITVDMT